MGLPYKSKVSLQKCPPRNHDWKEIPIQPDDTYKNSLHNSNLVQAYMLLHSSHSGITGYLRAEKQYDLQNIPLCDQECADWNTEQWVSCMEVIILALN